MTAKISPELWFCFPGCLKVSSVVPVFKNVGEMSTAKNYHPVSKVLEKTCK